jgi:hypothetical protein
MWRHGAQAGLPVLLEGGQKKMPSGRLADYEANVILLHETAIVCQVIICVEENNLRVGAFQIGNLRRFVGAAAQAP